MPPAGDRCDDDTLVHLDRLADALRTIESLHPNEESYLGHIKWRGWDVGGRFQACGGTWGDARKAIKDLLEGGIEHGTKRYPPCPHAAGPYPYMSGGMVCMSRPLALRMARDAHFQRFLALARKRNTHGTPCKRPLVCAAQPPAVHMWHHEDAGIGYNVFRAAAAGNASLNYIAGRREPGSNRSLALRRPRREAPLPVAHEPNVRATCGLSRSQSQHTTTMPASSSAVTR